MCVCVLVWFLYEGQDVATAVHTHRAEDNKRPQRTPACSRVFWGFGGERMRLFIVLESRLVGDFLTLLKIHEATASLCLVLCWTSVQSFPVYSNNQAWTVCNGLKFMGTYFVLQLQVWTEGTVTTLLVLVQAAVEFRLDWILFPQHHSEVDLLRTKRQLLRVHLNEWRQIERNFKAQVRTVEEENKTKSTHTDLNTFSVERYNINRTPWWPSGARQTRAAESSDLK